ncbi:MAG TPA: hypothetical protein DCS15_02135 [Flavobacteriales bacterium]|nr:diacylglyceryl transferase [Salibacteraceae bacterium]HAS35259.1 hypothetical protein [Flavobacteriales bacterium]
MNDEKQSWLERLQFKWGLKSIRQVILVLAVFACTGITVVYIKAPILNFLGISNPDGLLSISLYLLAVLPLYQILLLAYGFVFGQFAFFWSYEKKFFNRLFGRKKS